MLLGLLLKFIGLFLIRCINLLVAFKGHFLDLFGIFLGHLLDFGFALFFGVGDLLIALFNISGYFGVFFFCDGLDLVFGFVVRLKDLGFTFFDHLGKLVGTVSVSGVNFAVTILGNLCNL
jgi:hypothetical protein